MLDMMWFYRPIQITINKQQLLERETRQDLRSLIFLSQRRQMISWLFLWCMIHNASVCMLSWVGVTESSLRIKFSSLKLELVLGEGFELVVAIFQSLKSKRLLPISNDPNLWSFLFLILRRLFERFLMMFICTLFQLTIVKRKAIRILEFF